MWHIELFGGIRATLGDRIISHFESRKAVSLLAYLPSPLAPEPPLTVRVQLETIP